MTPEPLSTSPATSDGRIALDAGLLKTLRKTRGLSQEALAELCFQHQLPVSIASIKRAETGKAVLYRTARHLATIFEVELDTLVQPAAPAAAPALPAPVDAPSQAVRYLVQLHMELAAAPNADAWREIAHLVQHFGGQLTGGDRPQLLALFGAEQAYRSDSERAMRCALELSRALLVHGGRALALRLARRGEDSADADPHAPDLRQFDARPLAALPIYVARPLAAQLAQRHAFGPAAGRLPGYVEYNGPAPSDQAAPLPLAGRLLEVRQFHAIAQSALESNTGHVLYLRATAGVGKSRLAQEFAAIARELGFRSHVGEVQDANAESWRSPLEQLTRSLFGVTPDAPLPIEEAIESTVRELNLPAEWNLFYRALAGARMSSEQMSLYAAMSHAVRDHGIAQALQALILRQAAIEPLLLMMEDVHWAESYLLDALGGLLPLAREATVLWLLTSRPEQDPLEPALRPHLFDVPLTVFDLAPMPARDAQALADQFADVDAAYRHQCVERAQGNPLFLTQLLSAPEHQLPDNLKHLIQTRLDTLAPAHRQALRAAAAIGNRFTLAMLREVLGDADYTPESAGRHSLVRRVAPDTYVFVHDLVMHCIYDSIDPAQLRQLHRVIASLCREDDPALSAQHLYRAEDPGAFDMMLRAIRDKLAAHDYEDALELTAQCAAADSTRYSSFTLALLRSHATAGLGNTQLARERYEHALELAGRPQEKIEAVIGLATTLNILDELDEEERLLDDTLPLAHAVQATASLARLSYLKGNIYFPRGNYGECRRHHEDAVRHARASGAVETEARALSGLGDSFYAQGRMQRACEVFSQCIAMCEQQRFLAIEASNRSALGSTRLYLGQPDEAVADAFESALLAHKVGHRRAEVVARMTAGWVLAATGELDRATEQVEAGLDLTRSIGASRFEPFLMESQARISWLRGDRALAERQIMDAAALVERLQLTRYIGPWVLGTLALFAQDPITRKKALLRGAAHLTRDSLAHNAFRFHVNAAEIALLDGDTVTAEFHADELDGHGADEPCAWLTHHSALIRAYARWLDTHDDASRAMLDALSADAARLGFRFTTPRLQEQLA